MSDKSKKLGAANDKYCHFQSYFLLITYFRPRVFSLRDLQDDGNGHSSDDEKQTYYAGGEKSYIKFYKNDPISNYLPLAELQSKVAEKRIQTTTRKRKIL